MKKKLFLGAIFALSMANIAQAHCPQPAANTIRICWTNPTLRENWQPLSLEEIKRIDIYLDGSPIKYVTNRWYIEQGYTEYKPACYKAGSVITGTVTDTKGLKSEISEPFILPNKAGTTCP